jgi:two-component system NarL family sensor kinase
MLNFKSYIFILFFLLPLFPAGQVPGIDSIHNKYASEKNDLLRIRYHLKYIYLLINGGRQKEAEAEIALARKELEKFPVASLMPVLFYYEGGLKYDQTDYLQSIISLENSVKAFHPDAEKDNDGFTKGNVYISLGLSYSMINDWENAQLNYQKAIRENEKTKDSFGIARAYLNTAYIFSDVDDWVNASINLKRSTSYLNEKSNKYYQVAIYASLAEAYGRLNKLNDSKIYLKKSDSLIHLFSNAGSKTFADAGSKTFYFIAKGENALSAKNYSEALAATRSSLKYAREWGDSAFVAETLENMGRIYQAFGKYNEAVSWLTKSNDIAVKYNYMPQRKATLKQLLQLYKDNDQPEKALDVANKLFIISDSLAVVQNNNRRIIMDAVFESESKEKKIIELEQEKELQQLRLRQKNTFNYVLIISIITLLAISLLSYRNYKQKQKLQQLRISELETEKQLTATEAVLKGEEQERTRLAKDLHDGLGGLLSGVKFSLSNMKDNLIITPDNMAVFERSLDMIDTSIKELRRVAHNMMPEILTKFGLDEAVKEYCNTINSTKLLTIKYQSLGMENRLEKSSEIIIYRIVQELLNNIMKHAAATEVFVQIIREGNRLNVVVEDNGKGFDAGHPENNKGTGLTNVRSRVDYLKGQLDIHAEPGKGTLINIEFNV